MADNIFERAPKGLQRAAELAGHLFPTLRADYPVQKIAERKIRQDIDDLAITELLGNVAAHNAISRQEVEPPQEIAE